MSNIKQCIDSWIEVDKHKHFIVCFGLAIISPIIAIIVAIAKELYDLKQINNHFCWKDFVFDIIGIIFGAVIHVIILCLVI